MRSSFLFIAVYCFWRGGPVFKVMLCNKFKETHDKQIDLSQFSKTIVQFFVEYLYTNLENDKYIDLIIKNEIDPVELFRFAHEFQIDSLVNLAANAISLNVTNENIACIKELAERYDNKHLIKLSEKFFVRRDFLFNVSESVPRDEDRKNSVAGNIRIISARSQHCAQGDPS